MPVLPRRVIPSLLLILSLLLTGCSLIIIPEYPKSPASSEDTVIIAALKEPPLLCFSSQNIFPGDYFVILLKNTEDNDEITVSTTLLKNIPPFFPHSTGKIALIPVNYRTKPGQYPLFIKISRDGQVILEKEENIIVEPKKFLTQYLKVTASQEAQRTAELSAQDAVHTSKAKSVSAPQPLWEDEFIQPVEGRISTEYGLIRYINNVESGRHAGIDIAAPKGTPVKAANTGTVNLARKLNVTGYTVIIDHGLNVYSGYCHMDSLAVKDGDTVKKGDIIGKVGSTGFSTGPHLHWTVSFGQVFVNPWLFLEEDPLAWINAGID